MGEKDQGDCLGNISGKRKAKIHPLALEKGGFPYSLPNVQDFKYFGWYLNGAGSLQ